MHPRGQKYAPLRCALIYRYIKLWLSLYKNMFRAITGEGGRHLLVQPEVNAPEGPEIRFIKMR
jgi:hypothetical protein